jgi:tRNA pseudouridine38-40 synthase
MARYRAVVEYDGTGYAGFQRLTRRGTAAGGPRAATIQEVLEGTLAGLTGAGVRVLGAGRTDAGVHARGQVVAWDGDWDHPLPDLARALNAQLPEAIVVRELAEAALGFHPRFDASSRTYEYTLQVAPVRPAIGRQYVWHRTRPLDLAALQAAAAALIGEHDFGAFGRAPSGDNTVRRVLRAEWHARPPHLIFEIEANAFLYRMVRSLVGALHAVGTGALDVAAFAALLAAGAEGRGRRAGQHTAPAQGLCLTRVTYAPEGRAARQTVSGEEVVL